MEACQTRAASESQPMLLLRELMRSLQCLMRNPGCPMASHGYGVDSPNGSPPHSAALLASESCQMLKLT